MLPLLYFTGWVYPSPTRFGKCYSIKRTTGKCESNCYEQLIFHLLSIKPVFLLKSFQQAMVDTVAENYHNIWAKKKKKELDSKGEVFLLEKVFGSVLSKLSQMHWLIVCCHRKEEEVIHCWYRTTRWQQRKSTEIERRARNSLNSCRSMDTPSAGQCTLKFYLI